MSSIHVDDGGELVETMDDGATSAEDAGAGTASAGATLTGAGAASADADASSGTIVPVVDSVTVSGVDGSG